MRRTFLPHFAAIALLGCAATHPPSHDASTPDASTPDAGPDGGAMCAPTDADELRLPLAIYDDQRLATTLHAPSHGCGCEPRIPAFSAAAPTLALELCDCCEECDCIDPAYEASAVGAPWPIGMYELSTPLGPRALTVTSRDRTTPLAPTGLRVVPRADSLRTSGPRIDWAVLAAEQRLCCVSPLPVVDEGLGPMGELVLTLASAVQEDCACVGEIVRFEAWYPLIELPSGDHTVRAGPFEAHVLVP